MFTDVSEKPNVFILKMGTVLFAACPRNLKSHILYKCIRIAPIIVKYLYIYYNEKMKPTIKINVFWYVTPCSLLEMYQRFE